MAENAPHARRDPDRRPETAVPDGALEERWPPRRRFFVILGAATLCWLVPALIAAYLLSLR